MAIDLKNQAGPRKPSTAGRSGLRAAGYLSPLIIVLAMWIYGPAVFSVILSFMRWSLVGDTAFIGLENYQKLFGRPEFGQAVGQTLWYSIGMLPFATIVPMLLAIMLWQRVSRWSQFYRVVLFVPMMVAPVAHATSWWFLLQPLSGLANEIVTTFGLPAQNWLGEPRTALPTIIAVTAAKLTAQNMLLYTAALAGVRRNTLQAARLDGARWYDVTWHIVVPQLRGVTMLLGALSFITAGQWVFNNISVLTQGGPSYATDNVFYTIYRLGFTFFEMGQASAAAVLVALAVVALAGIIQLLRSRRAAA